MLTKEDRNRMGMMSLLLVLSLLCSGITGNPNPEPQGWLSSLFGGEPPLEPTGENLFGAASEGNLETVKDLVERGADVNYARGYILTVAADHGHYEVVKYLLESGANPNATDIEEYHDFGKVIEAAGKSGQVDIIDLLLDAGASVITPKYGNGVMDRAAENGHLGAVQRLLEAGADPNFNQGYAVLLAAKHGHPEIVKAFIQAGADVNEGDGWIISNAAEEGNIEIVQALIDAGATTDNLGYGLSYAAKYGHTAVVKLLIENGAFDDNGNGLRAAAEYGSVEMVRLLLDSGSNATYDVKTSPLHYAAKEGHIDVIALLVEHGVDINTALKEDAWFDFVTSIVDYGNGWTVMHVAARFGYTIMKELIDLGADINLQDVKGCTPLQIAVIYDKPIVAKDILRCCPDLNLVDNKGNTALDLAKEQVNKKLTNSSSVAEMMTILKSVMPEKLKTTPSNKRAIDILGDELKAMVDTNTTLEKQVNDTGFRVNSLETDSAFYFIFEERARQDMVHVITDHNCNVSAQGVNIAIGTEYLARCSCVPGDGPKLVLEPIEDVEMCAPSTPSPDPGTM